MSANEPEERELTEEEKIAAMEQALAIKPPSDEPTESAGSGLVGASYRPPRPGGS